MRADLRLLAKTEEEAKARGQEEEAEEEEEEEAFVPARPDIIDAMTACADSGEREKARKR